MLGSNMTSLTYSLSKLTSSDTSFSLSEPSLRHGQWLYRNTRTPPIGSRGASAKAESNAFLVTKFHRHATDKLHTLPKVAAMRRHCATGSRVIESIELVESVPRCARAGIN